MGRCSKTRDAEYLVSPSAPHVLHAASARCRPHVHVSVPSHLSSFDFATIIPKYRAPT